MDKTINIHEVAKKAGVGKSTVSRVLNNEYGTSEKSRQKVLKAIEELKYRPNISARYLRSNRSRLLGILIPSDISYEVIADNVNPSKLKGVVGKIRELDYDVLTFIEDVSDFQRLHSIIMEKGLLGILLFNEVPQEVLENFERYDIPYVCVNWFNPLSKNQCYVKTDLAKATVMSLELLLERGYGDIGVINWEDRIIEETFVDFMSKRGMNHKGCVWNTNIVVDDDMIWNYMDNNRKRAYLSFSYYASLRIMNYCKVKGLRIPEDIALISYEFFPFYDYLHPRLTGIKQRLEDMGKMAVEKLVAMIDGDRNVKSELLAPELIIRESC